MHEHGPNCLEGPIRGSAAWWRGLARTEEAAASPEQANRTKPSKTEDARIRDELVARIRSEIEAGTYDTPKKWQAALDRLMNHLGTED